MSDSLAQIKAALSDRYAIERELGAGGMATVYLARDLKHDRKVAVKVFRPELAAALGTERFFREIKITANLSHPHILPLLDSGRAVRRCGGTAVDESAEYLFYAMPFVEGESLRDKLNRERQLSVDDALKITSQVASALSYAHSRDIVHRDIKPENILFQAGEVVVADFGIALAVDSAGGTRLTETGFSVGTPAYMSPEQVSGEQEIDGRSDVYSLACVLYEMLAGDPPFVASNPRAVLAKHMTDPAPPITTVRSSVPHPVAAALTKALGKAPADRFESAKAFSEALYAAEVEVEEEKKSIVVLPFENLSPDPDQEYFSDGLTEEVISDLSKVSSLRVISRSSAMTFKGSDRRIPEIADELNVRYALEGSVRKAGNSLRITAQLIDAADDAHLWADKYTGTLDDVFEMQEQVSRAIVEALKVQITPEEEQRIAERPIDNVAAFECFLRSKQEVFKFTEEGIDRAIRDLHNALDMIGPNPHLYAGLAWAYWMYVNLGFGQEEAMSALDEYLEKALELQPDFPTALAIRGFEESQFRGDQQKSARCFKQALAVNPDESLALQGLAVDYLYQGRIGMAAPLAERLLSLDPLTFATHWINGGLSYYSGRFDGAAAGWLRLHELEPENPTGRFYYALALASAARVQEALEVLESFVTLDPDHGFVKMGLMFRGALLADKDAVVRELTSGFRTTAARDMGWAWHIADALAMVDETDDALKWLEVAVDRGAVNYPMLADHDPLLANIRGEDRFKTLIERVRREWESFEI